jgi:Na+-transporting methylmalonyl-CoA/oxaloacetate decarboxylase gamma subunit
LPAVDWGEATLVAGVGIGMVVGILVILAVATWITGVLLHRIDSRGKDKRNRPKREG